jgi:hypothetical protein
MQKTCTACGESQSVSAFGAGKNYSDGLNCHCKACAARATRAYRERIGVDAINATRREAYAADPERYRGVTAKWRRDNPKKNSESYARWRRANLESADGNARRWKKNNPERHRALKDKAEAKRRAGTKLEATPVDRLAVFARDGWRCRACLMEVQPNATPKTRLAPELDHIVPLSRGGSHTPDNVQLLCSRCNMRKGARLTTEELQAQLLEEWLQ